MEGHLWTALLVGGLLMVFGMDGHAESLPSASVFADPSEVGPNGFVLRRGEDIPFTPTSQRHGTEFSVLWGDVENGPVGILFRFPAGYEAPLHTHTSDYHAVVISGKSLHWLEGEDEGEMHGPGSTGSNRVAKSMVTALAAKKQF